MTRPLFLVVNGDTTFRASLEKTVQTVGGEYLGAADADSALDILEDKTIQVALVDTALRPETFATLMDGFRAKKPTAVVIGLGRELGAPDAVRLLEAGLFDLVPTPVEPQRLELAARRAMEQFRLLDSCRRLREGVRRRSGYQRLVGRSSFMENLRCTLERLAPGDGSILFSGPVGTGRELAARYLHLHSDRREGPFRILDCSAFPAPSLELELFGGEDREGLLAAGREGSVLLEEIGNLPSDIQKRLLDYLSRNEGGCRILGSSSTDLQQAVQAGSFREDLLGLLSPATVYLEPLSRRMEDLPLLASHFLDTICQINDLPPINLSSSALEVLGRHHWPGNIRELRNAMEQAAILATGTVQPEDLPARLREQEPYFQPGVEAVALDPFRAAKRKVVDAFEAHYLSELLMRKRGNVTAAAEQAGMLRSALQRLLRKHGIRSSDFRTVRGTGRSVQTGEKLPAD
ncbi:MAG: sigma-54-dependent Fis family transcriptional regulator [Acidobacteria bacterium]|uniref:Sigma-54-dependent Fis family transcriptional regulator n=1 Tax=Candidatus Polarisedimenticola svalbardensis TaxID=2886004 RepID=A0A8J7C2G1_9BACT|nr:sigma-54-dependent Fis family transcriptional regulator [Candidatus Polarisedimenticola svalbardensis]